MSEAYIGTDSDWHIGDAMLAAVAAGQQLDVVRFAASQDHHRDLHELTWIVRTCEAFPAGQRRADLPFSHHCAVLNLEPDQRAAMLARAYTGHWTGREIRRAVLNARVASGDFVPLVDDDREDLLYRRIAHAWNRASISAREMFLGSIEESHLADVFL